MSAKILVLLAAALFVEERLGCVTDEPCCFEELAKASEHYRFASPSWMRKCLRQVRLDGLGAKATAEIVTSMLRDFYIAPDLVKDTLKSDRTVIGRHNGTAQVHVLRADVDAAIRLALRDSQLRGSDGDGDDGLSYSAFSFHYGMADALRLLQDPNSRYDTPFGDWTLHRVVQLRPRRQPTGETEFVLADGPGWGRANGLNEEIYKRVHGVDPPRLLAYANKPVTHVNGIPVEKYLQTNADQLAAGRSSGTRLNWLLALGSTGEPLSLSSIRPPAVDEETFSFGGNIKATWKLTVRHRGTASGKSDLEALYGSSADFDELEGMLAAVSEAYTELWQAPCCSPATRAAPLESTDAADRFEAWARKVVDGAVNIAQPVSKALGALETGDGDGHDKNDVDGMEEEGNKTGHGDEVWDGDYEREGHGTQRQFQPAYYCDYDECDYSGEHYDYDDFREDGEADVTDDIVQVLLFNSGVPRAEGGAFLGVYFAREANAMIIKLNTFNPDGGAYGPLLGGAASGNPKGVSGKPFLAALHNAFETAAQFAKPRGITKMMLDVSGAVGRRGGKSADLAAFFLLRLLHTEWRGPGELCDAAAIRVTAFTELFAKGAAAAAQRLAGALAGVSGEDLKQAGLSLAQASLSASQMMVALGGAKLEESAETLRASASLLQVAVEAGQLTDGTLRELVNRFVLDRLQPAAEAAIREALGISASNIELLSGGKPQGLTWLDQGRWYAQHGGRNVSYTQRFFPSTCLAALEEFSVTGQRSFATAFTQVVLLVDGACGDGCSTLTSRLALSSSVRTVSHGGLVSLDAIDISPLGGGSGEGFQDVALSYLMLLLMGEEAMPSLDRLPRPLPTRAEVHLSVDTIFDPYLGTRALPREFYSLHADVHLPLWAESSGKLPRSSDAGSEGILPLWKIALLELASAPMLGDWLQAERDVDGSPPPPSTLPSISTEVLPHGGRQPILDVVLRDTLLLPTMQVTVISALIIFRDMIMSDVTDALRNTLRNRIAAGAGITVDHVVVISVMPGSVVWNISAVFPSTGLELVLDYKEALETNVPSLFSKDHVLHRFNPEKTASVQIGAAPSLDAYLAMIEEDMKVPRDSGSARTSTLGGDVGWIVAIMAAARYLHR